MSTIFNAVDKFFASLNNYIGLGDTFVIFISLFLVVAVVTFITASHSYEAKLIKAIDMLNGYFVNNPKITEDNLILFNQIMRHNKVPKLLRKHWQQFMLYREHNASYYMSFENCVEIPLRNSKFKRDRLIMNMFAYILAGISLIFNTYFTVETADVAYALQKILLTPIIILLLNYIASIILDLKEGAIVNDLHQNFQYFETNMDKATKSLPEYVDYEVLFDKAEIKKGIPVLYQYLQKRAEDEQRELELARLKNFEHEKFNFDEAGIASSLVLERAMTESENYIAQRKKYNEDIAQINSEIAQEDIKYRDATKEYNRQMQISKETFANFKKELEEATSTIQANYIKKQQQQELDRQRNLERDFDMQSDRHKKIISKYQQDLDAIDSAVAESKKALEDAMMAEFSTYSGKVYDEAKKVVEERQAEKFAKIKQNVKELEEQLYQKNKDIENLSKQVAENVATETNNSNVQEQQVYVPVEEPVQNEQENIQPVEESNSQPTEEFVSQPTQEMDNQTFNNFEEPQEENFNEQPQEDSWNFDYLNGSSEENSNTENQQDFALNEDNTMSYSDYLKNEGLEAFNLDEQPTEEIENKDVEESEPADESTVQQDESENIGENVEQNSQEQQEEQNSQSQEEQDGQEQEEENFDWLDKLLEEADIEAEEKLTTDQVAGNNVEQSTEEIQPAEVVKKKAGRPRKVVEETAVEPKRGRGRPKKTETATESETVATEPTKKRGRPRKEKTEVVKTETKKSVGRPKKEETISTEAEQTNVTKKKAGRPKKVVEETAVEPKRGRGRPKKGETVSNESAVTEPTKKRGRPRKDATVKTETKKSVGRPKKSNSVGTTKKKAGRPRTINLNNVDTDVDLDAYLKVIDNAIAKENAKMKRTQKALESQANIKHKNKK